MGLFSKKQTFKLPEYITSKGKNDPDRMAYIKFIFSEAKAILEAKGEKKVVLTSRSGTSAFLNENYNAGIVKHNLPKDIQQYVQENGDININIPDGVPEQSIILATAIVFTAFANDILEYDSGTPEYDAAVEKYDNAKDLFNKVCGEQEVLESYEEQKALSTSLTEKIDLQQLGRQNAEDLGKARFNF